MVLKLKGSQVGHTNGQVIRYQSVGRDFGKGEEHYLIAFSIQPDSHLHILLSHGMI